MKVYSGISCFSLTSSPSLKEKVRHCDEDFEFLLFGSCTLLLAFTLSLTAVLYLCRSNHGHRFPYKSCCYLHNCSLVQAFNIVVCIGSQIMELCTQLRRYSIAFPSSHFNQFSIVRSSSNALRYSFHYTS